ncbi:MAG: GAF domain-containing protein [Acidobacteria bacterium]|nr:GAF domain-containing protein [Acidobacteriota bacterium]
MAENVEIDLEQKFKALIETIDVANLLTVPITEAIRNLLRISSASINSEEASVLIRDGSEGDLRFLTAIGEVADKLIDLPVPAGKGIAGFVMSSGQPMTISEAGQEQSFYAEVDKTTGFSTQTVLATPLQYEEEVLGVLEYVNRIGDPPYEPFTPEEMDKAAFFAEAIAPLVNTYETARSFRALGEKFLGIENQKEFDEIRTWLAGLRETEEHKQMLDLAILVREFSTAGEKERDMCREILETFLKYSDNNSDADYSSL